MLGIAIKHVDYQDSLKDKHGDCRDSLNGKIIVLWQPRIQFIDYLDSLKIVLTFVIPWASQFYSDRGA